MNVGCFYLVRTDVTRRTLRRYTSGDGGWTCETGWHEASNLLDEVTGDTTSILYEEPQAGDKWPTHCNNECGYAFQNADRWQLFCASLWEVQESLNPEVPVGKRMTLREAPAGAIWRADWLEDLDWHWRGPDGHVLVCKLPNGLDWMIDSRANNCTRPDDDTHRCWVRHGAPPNLHVDKNGDTCAAGAGSIGSGNGDRHWHGFLHGGHLVGA